MCRKNGILFLSQNTGVQVKGLNISVSASEKLSSFVSRSYSASHFIMMSAIHTQTSVIPEDDLISLMYAACLQGTTDS
jgi:hypothetical protein